MEVDQIKVYLVREIGMLVLHYAHHNDRKIVTALMEHSDSFSITFIQMSHQNVNFFNFTFSTDSGIDENSPGTEFTYALQLNNASFAALKAALVEALGHVWYIPDDLAGQTESVGTLLERLSSTVNGVVVGDWGYVYLSVSDVGGVDGDDDIEADLEAYLPEDIR